MQAFDELLAAVRGASQRAVVIGNAGSGKSTLARALGSRLGAASLDLDRVYWEPGRIAQRRAIELARADVDAFCDSHTAWIVEGCYAELAQPLLARAPLLLWLDPGLETCLRHCRARPWEPHKFASAAEQDAHLGALLEWVAAYETRTGELSRSGHSALFENYAGPRRHLRQELALASMARERRA